MDHVLECHPTVILRFKKSLMFGSFLVDELLLGKCED